MINSEYRDLYFEDSIKKVLKITFENTTISESDILADTFRLTERLCSGEQYEVGSCEASEINFTVANNYGRLKGKELTVSVYIDGAPESEIPLGKYTVSTDKASADRRTREIVAYDKMYQLSQTDVSEWYNNVFGNSTSMSYTLFGIRLLSHLGLTGEILPIMSTTTVSRTMSATDLMATDVLRALGEMGGVCYKISRDGSSLKAVDISANSVVTYNSSLMLGCAYEDFNVNPISKVTFKADYDSEGFSSGIGTNEYQIVGNFLLSQTQLESEGYTLATKALGHLDKVGYTPVEADAIGNPCIEVGDKVTFTANDGTAITTIVMQRTLSGINGMTDSITSLGEENREAETGIAGQLNSMGLAIQKLAKDISRENSAFEIDYEPKFTVVNGAITEINFPATTFTHNIPVNNTIQLGSGVKFRYAEEDLSRHVGTLVYDTSTDTAYRFTQTNGVFGWSLASDSDFGVAMSKIVDVSIDVDGITETVRSQKVEIDTQGQRITTAEGQLKIQDDKIGAKVSKVEGDASTSCAWDLTTDAFKVYSNGEEVLNVDSDGLKVKGAIESNSAIITGGSINIETGAERENFITLRNDYHTTNMGNFGFHASTQTQGTELNSDGVWWVFEGEQGYSSRIVSSKSEKAGAGDISIVTDGGDVFFITYGGGVYLNDSKVLTEENIAPLKTSLKSMKSGMGFFTGAAGYRYAVIEGAISNGDSSYIRQTLTIMLEGLSEEKTYCIVAPNASGTLVSLPIKASTYTYDEKFMMNLNFPSGYTDVGYWEYVHLFK